MTKVYLQKQNYSFEIEKGETILQAGLRQGIRIPHSCRNGSCRTCFSQCLKGNVESKIEWPSLSYEEKAQGYILPCVYQLKTQLRDEDLDIVLYTEVVHQG